MLLFERVKTVLQRRKTFSFIVTVDEFELEKYFRQEILIMGLNSRFLVQGC